MQKKISLLFLFFSLSFYAQNDTISVIKHTDKDIIVNKESKVVYRGIPNSLSIEVPSCKSFKAYGEGLSLMYKNIYNLNAGSGLETVITVDIVLKNNKKKTEKHLFKIKNLGNLVVSLNYNDESYIRLQKSKLDQAVLRVKFEDKNLQQDFITIRKFKIKIADRKEIEVLGNRIDSNAFQMINKNYRINDEITIYDIVTEIHCGISTVKLKPIVIKIL
jgi:GldM C-terminal domain